MGERVPIPPGTRQTEPGRAASLIGLDAAAKDRSFPKPAAGGRITAEIARFERAGIPLARRFEHRRKIGRRRSEIVHTDREQGGVGGIVVPAADDR